MFIAIFGLLQIRAHFGQSSLWSQFKRWLQGLLWWKKEPVIGDLNATMGITKMTAQGQLSCADDPDKSEAERINILVKNLDLLRQVQGLHARLIEELKGSHEDQKKESENQRLKLKTKFQKALEISHTSDLFLSFVGLVWLTVGIILSTLSVEICQWIS
jgi:hypothetical protein